MSNIASPPRTRTTMLHSMATLKFSATSRRLFPRGSLSPSSRLDLSSFTLASPLPFLPLSPGYETQDAPGVREARLFRFRILAGVERRRGDVSNPLEKTWSPPRETVAGCTRSRVSRTLAILDFEAGQTSLSAPSQSDLRVSRTTNLQLLESCRNCPSVLCTPRLQVRVTPRA